MAETRRTGPASGRWLPAESVVIVSDKTVGAPDTGGSNDDFQIQAAVVRAKNGDLLVMTTLVNPHRIVLLRSRDQGKTWSAPNLAWQKSPKEELYFGFGSMQVLPSGRILAIIWGYNAKGWAKADIRTPWFPLYSDDHGMTWKPGPMNTTFPPFLSNCAYNPFRATGEGTVILPVWGHVQRDEKSEIGGTFANGFLQSHDEGITWTFGNFVMRGEKAIGTMPNEISILPLRSGNWLAVFRMNWVKPSVFPSVMLFRSLSRDQGRSWSAPQQVLGQTGYVCLQQLPDGAVMVSGSGAFGTRYLISYDEGSTWAYEQPVESCGDAATTSVVLDERTVFLVHGSGMGAPHHPAYWYAGLRGRWIRKT